MAISSEKREEFMQAIYDMFSEESTNEKANQIIDIFDAVTEKCVDLPCVAIVEQFLDSDGKFDKRRIDHNGRIAVVYINRHKYAVPSIDLTSQRYNTAKAYERIEELNREEIEQALKERETK